MSLHSLYEYIIYEKSDYRARDHWLLGPPWLPIGILTFYIYFVRVLGPMFMKTRQPYNIDRLLIVYNIIQIFWNGYTFSYVAALIREAAKIPNFSYWCIPYKFTDTDALSNMIFEGAILYTANKFFDLLETIFFVLRKKDNQISYLHIYHHLLMCTSCWIGAKYAAGGNPIMVAIVNSGIHFLMYIYYLLSNLGYKRWLWWKKHLTQLQIIQFTCVLYHNLQTFFLDGCEYFPIMSAFACLQAIYLIYLFSNFYFHAYIVKKKKVK